MTAMIKFRITVIVLDADQNVLVQTVNDFEGASPFDACEQAYDLTRDNFGSSLFTQTTRVVTQIDVLEPEKLPLLYPASMR